MEERVQKIIANAGFCSRRKAEQFIIEGLVKVNGKVIGIGDKADSDKDSILVDGRPIERPKKLYIAFHKPAHCLTTLSDPQGRKTIFSYLPFRQRLIPVGRLDFNTEGLLLLTNDGEFANRVMHPRYEVEKTYIVFLDKPFIKEHIEALKKGIDIEGQRTNPAKVRYASDAKDMIEVTIHEGRNRIVRRMMKELGYIVNRLIRTKIGTVSLGSMNPGTNRNLSFDEIKSLTKSK